MSDRFWITSTAGVERHALAVFEELETTLRARGGSIRVMPTADGSKIWATWIKQNAPGLEGPIGPVVTDNTLRGALANLLEAMRDADHT